MSRPVRLLFLAGGPAIMALFVVGGSESHGVFGGVMGAVVVTAGLATAWRLIKPFDAAIARDATTAGTTRGPQAGVETHRFQIVLYALAVAVAVSAGLLWLSTGGLTAAIGTGIAVLTAGSAILVARRLDRAGRELGRRSTPNSDA
jgi:hypothetical protein